MRNKKFLRLILVLSLMVSATALKAESTPPSSLELKPVLTQVSPQDLPIYTEDEVVEALRIAPTAEAPAALDKAVPLAVQAAVAEKEGQRAKAQAFADFFEGEVQVYKSKVWKAFGWGTGIGVGITVLAGIAGALLTR